MSRQRAWSTVELLIGLIVTTLMLIALYGLFQTVSVGSNLVENITSSSRDARNPLDTLGDHLRNAQNAAGKVVSAASSNDITYYTDTTGSNTARYHLSGTSLVRTVGSTNTTVLYNVTNLTLAYFTSTTYNSSTMTATTSPSVPTSGELPNLAAIRITASTTTGGKTIQYSTLVRLRNSPVKVNLKGN